MPNLSGEESRVWTNPSIRKFAARQDPVEAMISYARLLTLKARDAGWSGPPFDPIQLAEYLKIEVKPNGDILDAELYPCEMGGM